MSYELRVVNKLNQLFTKHTISAICYRLKQAKFCFQICDLIVDSSDRKYYLAIQCKTTKYGLFFSSNFSDKQIQNITEFLNLSGRCGVLALRDRKEDYLIPWKLVHENYITNKKGVNKKECNNYKVDYNSDESVLSVLSLVFSEN